ncbi:MAG: hypothetical protein C4289_07670 [Chloroflexota bacterium]
MIGRLRGNDFEVHAAASDGHTCAGRTAGDQHIARPERFYVSSRDLCQLMVKPAIWPARRRAAHQVAALELHSRLFRCEHKAIRHGTGQCAHAGLAVPAPHGKGILRAVDAVQRRKHTGDGLLVLDVSDGYIGQRQHRRCRHGMTPHVRRR